ARTCAVAQFNDLTSPGTPVEERLRTFVRAVLKRFFDEGRPAWLGKLVAREMIEPSNALDGLVNGQIRPNSERLRAVVRELIGREIDEQELWRCTFSIAAQWLLYFHCGQVVKRLNPDQRFDAGRIRGNIRVENAKQEEALAVYEKTVLRSLQDVEDTLVAYAQEQVRYRSLKEGAEADQRAGELANELYTKGLADFLNVLDAQRSLYLAQDQLVQSQKIVSQNLVSLYKALGGGWEVETQLAQDKPTTR